MRRKNDLLWKGILEEVFDDLLRFIFPQADQLFDMSRVFEFLDKELNEIYPEPYKKGRTRFVDKLVKVFRQDGGEEWLLIHVEVQGHMDRFFAERMFRYYYRIFDRYGKPVTAIAIFTGMDGKDMPRQYEHSLLGTRLLYQYNTFRIMDYPDDHLSASDNPFALVVLAAKTALLAGKVPERELLDRKLLVAKLLFSKQIYTRHKIEGILAFLNNYVLFEDQETNLIFVEQINKITGKVNTMGILEQLAEIRAEEAMEKASRLFVENLLANTDFSQERIAALANVSADFVNTVKGNLSDR
jgi:hypothetical protein